MGGGVRGLFIDINERESGETRASDWFRSATASSLFPLPFLRRAVLPLVAFTLGLPPPPRGGDDGHDAACCRRTGAYAFDRAIMPGDVGQKPTSAH